MQSIKYLLIFLIISVTSCLTGKKEGEDNMKDIRLMTVDPGHFHAALVQKNMYEEVSPEVFVFAPEGEELNQHLERIETFNNRSENPTSWEEKVYAGPDFFEQMLKTQPGNVVVLAGNNRKKTDYILESVKAGLNVLADKPMVITPDKFPLVEKAFSIAEDNKVLLYDIMTERYEITTMLQKALSQNNEIFGQLVTGSPDKPAVTKESVHHFFKYVSGSALTRPPWFFDTEQQGEGIVDVTTHLVDLIQWECYPGEILEKSDIEIIEARRWPTVLSADGFSKVTGMDDFPPYLEKDIIDGELHVYANGEILYKIKDTYARVLVEWKYRAPEGTGDTHYSIMRGTKSNLVIRQGEKEGYIPVLYIELENNLPGFEDILKSALDELPWDGVEYLKVNDNKWKLIIPEKYRLGHEAHFGQVMEKYLEYLEKGKMPEWEVPNMIVKYYTTTEALRKALE
ncbi:MAG: putative oxidoreductase C-terminal domain-containing protein [Bacteroidota bacterium]|nr:putative oxidoreductase C-terminal domain-containing protein [Bacteroidota bacterium]